MIDESLLKSIPVEEFPLAGRWTQSTHPEFGPSELASMRAIDSTSSSDLQDFLRVEGITRSLQTTEPPSQRVLDAEQPGDRPVQAWLQDLPFSEDQRVLLSYRWSDVLELPWSLFVARWSTVDSRLYRSHTIVMKTAVSLPDPVFQAADELAGRLGLSRSALYAEAVSEFLKQHRQDGVTESLNAIYSVEAAHLDPVLQELQSASLTEEEW